MVQFDQIAEDQSCGGGTGNCPGNGLLDGGENAEDANGNGALEMEVNINPFKIQFYSGEIEMSLEGFRSITQTSDSDVISLYPTISDAKKLELNIIEPSNSEISVIINKGAFVDLNYNPNMTDTLVLNIIADEMPLLMTNATYDLGLNEFIFSFDNSRNVEKESPFPVYSKIKILGGDESVVLNGVNLISPAISTNLKISELLFSDQKAVESLISNSLPPYYVELEPYAIYDEMGNVNPADTLELNILGQYSNPVLSSVSYESGTNRIIFDWSPGKVVFYDLIRLYETVVTLPISCITVTNTNTLEELQITSAMVSRNNTMKMTYLEVSEEDSKWFELAGVSGDNLTISVDPYVFYSSGSTNNNGNFAIPDSTIYYMTDVQGPSVTSFQIDTDDRQLIIEFDKNVDISQSEFVTATLVINGMEIEISGLELVETETYVNSLSYQIPDDQFENVSAIISTNEVFTVEVILPAGSFHNMDNTSSLGCQDFNGNGVCDTLPEPFNALGIDNIPDSLEPAYSRNCNTSGGCSDPTLLTHEACATALG